MSSIYSRSRCLLAVALLGLFAAGCSNDAPQPAAPNVPAPPSLGAADGSAESADEKAEIEAALASLPEADRAAAVAQMMCPVSDHPLGSGSMGTPIKVTVEGRDVFICCEACREALLADPQKYLAKLEKPAQ